MPGTVYAVVRLIGGGGMGTVYDVEDTSIGKRYVMKTLHPQLGARHDLARRMQNEARTLARLNHPNIVEVITAGLTGDDLRLPFFVMERLNGQSLRQVLEKKWQLDLARSYQIAIDLLEALDHAHDKGVVHRDVKPDNIFLHRTSAGFTVTKLLDFGIQSVLDASLRDTAGRFLGTLRYAAPEQLRGERPTPAVDLYATGLVLYEMLAGRGPFDDEGEPHAIGAAHMDKPPPLLSRFVQVPSELEALIEAALSKRPEGRPHDAFSFAASLRILKKDLARCLPGELAEGATPEPASFDPPRVSPAPPPASAPTAIERLPPLRPPPPPLAASARTTAPHSADVLRRPGSPPWSGPAALTSLAPDEPLVWPRERTVVKSDDPQVQMLSLPAPRPARRWPRLVAAVFSGALAAAVILVVGRHPARTWSAIEQRPSVADGVLAPAPPLPAAPPILAPTPLAVPSEPSPAATTPTSKAREPVAPPAASSAAIKRRPAPAMFPKPGVSAARVERPGPGF